MKVFYCPTTGALAEIPADSDGGVCIVALVASGAGQYLECSEDLRGHVDAGHCQLDSGNNLQLKPESEWPENQTAGGE